jgi:hypothetical protein
MSIKRSIVSLIISLMFIDCGSIGTGVGNPPTPSTKAAATLTGIFNLNSDGNLNAALQAAMASQPRGVIADFCNSINDSPSHVTNSYFKDPGTYGSSEEPVTLSAEDFCQLSDGTINTGTGPDGKGIFGGFTLNGDVDYTCTSAEESFTITMRANSNGVFRNTDATAEAPAYFPEIYGTFTLIIEDVSATVDCTMFLLDDQTADYTSCSDETGALIEQDTDVTCQINAD